MQCRWRVRQRLRKQVWVHRSQIRNCGCFYRLRKSYSLFVLHPHPFLRRPYLWCPMPFPPIAAFHPRHLPHFFRMSKSNRDSRYYFSFHLPYRVTSRTVRFIITFHSILESQLNHPFTLLHWLTSTFMLILMCMETNSLIDWSLIAPNFGLALHSSNHVIGACCVALPALHPGFGT